jgi:hypothetical protein
LVLGALAFDGSISVPVALDGPASLTSPVTVEGLLEGYSSASDLNDPEWQVLVEGSGAAAYPGTYGNGEFGSMPDVSFSFTGTATPVPEPGFALPLASFLMALTLRPSKFRTRSHKAQSGRRCALGLLSEDGGIPGQNATVGFKLAQAGPRAAFQCRFFIS